MSLQVLKRLLSLLFPFARLDKLFHSYGKGGKGGRRESLKTLALNDPLFFRADAIQKNKTLGKFIILENIF